jgi:hypothetical protein
MKINAHKFGSNCIVIIKDSYEFNKVQFFLKFENITFLITILVIHYIWGNIVNYHIQI